MQFIMPFERKNSGFIVRSQNTGSGNGGSGSNSNSSSSKPEDILNK